MEKSTKLRDGDEKENITLRGQEVLKEEPQRKKKLVVFEIDNINNAENVYEVSNFKIEEIFRSRSKGFGGGHVNGEDDGLTLRTSSHQDRIPTAKSCQLPFDPENVGRMMFDEFGIDVIELQNRILELEKQLKNDNLELPPIFSDLKSQVENFRNKLETSERYGRAVLQKGHFYQRYQYRRTSSERGRKIREKFLNICEKEISETTKDWLKQPSFDSSKYEDEEILLFLQHMFIELGLVSKFDIRLPILRSFLYEIYKNYNEVPFHNFRHCFCVAQMMYVMIWSVDIPKKMGELDTLILLTSCICHDLDHPGYNNIYQINARTELALLYNDISPLENHHCSVAFRILENPECNIFVSLDKETFKEVREGIIRCILATDMARHNEILTQFKDIIHEFDFGNKAHKNLLSMILIKVADISNEARPMNVAEPWLDRLLMEFFKQSDAEKKEGLPVTPFMDREKITKPSSQCSFIGFVLLPLFEALGELLPQLHDLIIAPAKYALDHYRRLNEAAKDERLRRKSVVEITNLDNNSEDSESSGMVKSGSGLNMRSKRSFSTCSQSRQRSKSTDEFEIDATPPSSPSAFSASPEDLQYLDEREEIEEDEIEEEETVTEVEVSEKTLKFKISTEGSSSSFPGRRSCPGNCSGSRKGSKERNQYLENDVEWSRTMKDEDGRSLKRSITSETMNSRKGSSGSEKTLHKGGGDSEKENCTKSSRGKDHRPKMSYNKKKLEYRRKSLATVERTREWDHSKRRKSTSNTQESLSPSQRTRGETSPRGGKESGGKKKEEFLLKRAESPCKENSVSLDFETSCWGLQNLKKDTVAFNATPIILKKSIKNSFEKNLEIEKSKSEDNLTIKGFENDKISPAVRNNVNVSKMSESLEKNLTRDSEKKKKLGSNGHLSLITKLKHLKERISFGRDSDELFSSESAPNSGEKINKRHNDNQNTSKECEDDCERSRTLPKAKKPNRTSTKTRRGWRALIWKSGGDSSSLEVLPPTGSPSPVRARPRRKSSVEEGKPRGRNADLCSAAAQKKKTSWLSSPKRVGFLSRIARGEEESSKQNFLNNLTSSFRKRGNKNEEENGASSSGSAQEGSKPN